MSDALAALVLAALTLDIVLALVAFVGMCLPRRFHSADPHSRTTVVTASALLGWLAWTPVVVVLAAVAGMHRDAAVLAVVWALFVAALLFGPGGPGRRWARRTADRVRDAGHRLVVEPAGASA